jgi:site-specific recombinase XerD
MAMRACDVTFGDPVGQYMPEYHKTAWRGKQRLIPLGPQAQAIIKGFLKPSVEAFLFDPQDVLHDLHERRTGRKWQRSRKSRRYDRRTYRQAVVRACDRAFPHPQLSGRKNLTVEQRQELALWRKLHRWFPLQLRHLFATEIRATHGLEASQVLLGHAKADTTEIYAQKNLDLARKIAAQIG